MNFTEQALVFKCADDELLGILALPEAPKTIGVLIVVGGPQYRVGSHRQFLQLARRLGQAGYPVMRFDSRGMGDSSGALRDFEAVNDDIASAINVFQRQCPKVDSFVILGLCDGASASLLYWDSLKDARLGGLVLLNPWVRSETTQARVQLKHYYGQRLLEGEFWRKLFAGRINFGRALGGFTKSWQSARQCRDQPAIENGRSFQQKMAQGLATFNGPILVMLSENDYTAKEFLEVARTDPVLSDALAKSTVTQTFVAAADHTFSSAESQQNAEQITLHWLENCGLIKGSSPSHSTFSEKT